MNRYDRIQIIKHGRVVSVGVTGAKIAIEAISPSSTGQPHPGLQVKEK